MAKWSHPQAGPACCSPGHCMKLSAAPGLLSSWVPQTPILTSHSVHFFFFLSACHKASSRSAGGGCRRRPPASDCGGETGFPRATATVSRQIGYPCSPRLSRQHPQVTFSLSLVFSLVLGQMNRLSTEEQGIGAFQATQSGGVKSGIQGIS